MEAQNDFRSMLHQGTAPKNVRMLLAGASLPLPPQQTLELVILLLKDADPAIAARAAHTLDSWDREELIRLLESADCPPAVPDYFAGAASDERILQAVAGSPAATGESTARLALTAPPSVLEKVLDNRVRILACPAILENAGRNPQATPGIRRLIGEIQAEFFGGKRTDYAVEEAAASEQVPEEPAAEEWLDAPPEDLSLEGLPEDPEARQAELNRRITSLSTRQKVQHALFGNREIRMILVRDTNKEVAKSVLRSPKLTDNEVESIAVMRGVSEDILNEIAKSKNWTRSYAVVHNLVRNPKTPPAVSQRLMFRLRAPDLMLLTRDRSIPDAVRQYASRALKQRSSQSR